MSNDSYSPSGNPVLVVHIDGACRGNGTDDARAAYGVYFGPQSPYNRNGLVSQHMPQTSTRAEIEALSEALDIVEEIFGRYQELKFVDIVTDSSYLVKAMTEYIDKWISTGGYSSQGRPIAHFDRLRQLDQQIYHLTNNNWNNVEFKHVRRCDNREADALANQALDEASEDSYGYYF